MEIILIYVAFIILISVILNRFSDKVGIPALLLFIILGLIFGEEGIFKIPFDDYKLVSDINTIALVFIMFYGGFGTNWDMAKPVALHAILMSTLGTIITALTTGAFVYYVLHFSFLEAMLMGSVIASTDAASVFSILRSKKLNLKYNTASLLELESGSNDPTSYMLTMIVLAMMKGNASKAMIAKMFFSQMFFGLTFGLLIAYVALFVLRKFDFTTNGFDAVFVISIALFSFALPEALGGNGYLSAYVVGLILGNNTFKNKIELVHFFNGVTGLMQVIIFFLLGLLALPSMIPAVFLKACLIMLFLTFIARPLATLILMGPLRSDPKQMTIVAWSGLRGAASIVFAIMASIDGVYLENDIYHIVFAIVLMSILIQGSLIPVFSKKLNMIDDKVDVLKTFNDYSEEVEVDFIQLKIDRDHLWFNMMIKDINLPPGILAVSIIRGKNNIAPRGNTILKEDDQLILSALSADLDAEISLTEIDVTEHEEYVGSTISQLDISEDRLVIMIKREDETIIPDGNTIIEKNDIIVLNHDFNYTYD